MSAAISGEGGIAVDAIIGENKLYNVELKLTKDIIAPSYQKSIDTFLNTVEKIGLEKVANDSFSQERGEQFVEKFKNLDKDDVRDDAYIMFVGSFMRDSEAKKSFFKDLSDQGYNAIIDDNDAKLGKSELKTPMIVFDKQKTMSKINAQELSDKDKDFFNYLFWDDTYKDFGVPKEYKESFDKWEKYAGKKIWN